MVPLLEDIAWTSLWGRERLPMCQGLSLKSSTIIQ
jgi:hypothetical protein